MQTQSTEKDRKREEALRNDARFDAYNARRADAGLPALDWVEYCVRKHGLDPKLAEVQRLAADEASPEHRDTIVLFRR